MEEEEEEEEGKEEEEVQTKYDGKLLWRCSYGGEDRDWCVKGSVLSRVTVSWRWN